MEETVCQGVLARTVTGDGRKIEMALAGCYGTV
jgi:hypothetical protein